MGSVIPTMEHRLEGSTMAYRDTPDGAHYRVVAQDVSPTSTRIDVERELDGDQWITIQTWTIPLPAKTTAAARRVVLVESCQDHGWGLARGDWPRRHNGRQVLTGIDPLDWGRIVEEATQLRNQRIEEFAAYNKGWNHVIHTAVTVGALGPTVVARASGMSRERIKQIVAEVGR